MFQTYPSLDTVRHVPGLDLGLLITAVLAALPAGASAKGCGYDCLVLLCFPCAPGGGEGMAVVMVLTTLGLAIAAGFKMWIMAPALLTRQSPQDSFLPWWFREVGPVASSEDGSVRYEHALEGLDKTLCLCLYYRIFSGMHCLTFKFQYQSSAPAHHPVWGLPLLCHAFRAQFYLTCVRLKNCSCIWSTAVLGLQFWSRMYDLCVFCLSSASSRCVCSVELHVVRRFTWSDRLLSIRNRNIIYQPVQPEHFNQPRGRNWRGALPCITQTTPNSIA